MATGSSAVLGNVAVAEVQPSSICWLITPSLLGDEELNNWTTASHLLGYSIKAFRRKVLRYKSLRLLLDTAVTHEHISV